MDSSPKTPPGPLREATAADLVKQASEQLTQLVRTELRLAQVEMKQKGKRFGLGGGLFGAAGLVAVFALQAAVATVIIALALVWPPWLAALVVTFALSALAAVLAAAGKKEVAQAGAPAPQEAIDNVKTDVAHIKESAQR
ncbi:phage holin family protein [Streptomyces sp. JJ66]|uniref:phage holin family protein n=1 Tax=Streptomyces sp. JJ66 TaxID=2803843 RepID=UPI001C55A5A5|nr:phage holin family protein [Streptomyces sp. JJ66]MBW1604321.1 phage holin family protein [Streptomyces sp. JJ66]